MTLKKMQPKNEIMTYRQEKRQAAQLLQNAGIAEYAADAELLLREAAGFDMTQSLLHGDDPMPEEQRMHYRVMIRRRAQREPLQHITGHQNFMGYEFRTGPEALIPRQDTEVLVYEALHFLREQHTVHVDEMRVLDVCTGTGCIVESLSLEFPGPAYYGCDISGKALDLAKINAEQLGTQVTLMESDLLDQATGIYDLIVSNPPYIPDAVIRDLDPEVRDHDPYLALSGGDDGLAIYRRLIPDAYAYLKSGGALMLEIGSEQAEAVGKLLHAAGYTQVRVVQDPAGLDRVVTAAK